MASGLGHPPPFIQFNDSQCKKALASTTTYWDDLVMMYDVQRFVNRFTTAMTALIAAGGVVPESVVSGWESEFEVLRPLMIPHDTGMSSSPFSKFQCRYFQNERCFDQPNDSDIELRNVPLHGSSCQTRNPNILLSGQLTCSSTTTAITINNFHSSTATSSSYQSHVKLQSQHNQSLQHLTRPHHPSHRPRIPL